LKFDGQLVTLLKKSETKDQNKKKARKLKEWFEIDAFWRHFLLNETARFGQNGAVSCTVKKREREKEANGAVLNGAVSLLLPLHAQRTGEEKAIMFPCNATIFLSLCPHHPGAALHLDETGQGGLSLSSCL